MISAMAPSFWDDQENLESLLGRSLARGQVLVCLGAGISYFARLPSWDTLLTRIADSTSLNGGEKTVIAAIKDPYARASELRRSGFNDDSRRFVEALRDALYQGGVVNKAEDAFQDPGMQALSFLCSRSIRGGCNNIVTYNFDDLVEKMFRHGGVVAESIASPQFVSSRADVSVFHPHGFVPNEIPLPANARPVITAEDRAGPMHDHWAEVLVYLYSKHLPLLIGLSGKDKALIDALTAAKARHKFIGNDGWPYFGVAIGVGDMDTKALHGAGIKVMPFPKPETWPAFVGRVCGHASAHTAGIAG